MHNPKVNTKISVEDKNVQILDSLAITVPSPYGAFRLPLREASDYVGMRSRQLRGVLYLMQANDSSNTMLRLAESLSGDLAEAVLARDADAPARAQQLHDLLRLQQDDTGPDDLEWLCQQMAEEICAVAAAVQPKVAEVQHG